MKDLLITIDTDWAPDWLIDETAAVLLGHEAKATWFVTHSSPAIHRLREHPDLFELGIHPNFNPNSSHGSNVNEIMDYCMAIVPDAKSMRTHGLHQSTNILHAIAERREILFDVSLFLQHGIISGPVEHKYNGSKILRLPFNWMDDFEMYADNPGWTLSSLDVGDCVVLDLHPVHIGINSPNHAIYEALKSEFADIGKISKENFLHHAASSPGPGPGPGPKDMLISAASADRDQWRMHTVSSFLEGFPRGVKR